MKGLQQGWDRWLFWVVYPILSFAIIHVGNDNSLRQLMVNPTYYSDLILSFGLTFATGYYFRWYYRRNGVPFGEADLEREEVLRYLFSAILFPVAVLTSLEAIYVLLILGIPLGEVSILWLELPLIFLFCLLINACYLIMGVYEKVTDEAQDPEVDDQAFRSHFVVHSGTASRNLAVEEIAYFQVVDKVTFLVEWDGRRSVVDYPLREIEALTDPNFFFPLNRQIVAHRPSIVKFNRTDTRKLSLQLRPDIGGETFVSKLRATAFLQWLNEEKVSAH